MIQALKDFPTWGYQLSIYMVLFNIFMIAMMRRFKLTIREGKEGEGEAFGEKTVMALQNSFNKIFYSSIGMIATVFVVFLIYFIVKLS